MKIDLWFTYRAGATQWRAVRIEKVSSGSTKLVLISKIVIKVDSLIPKKMTMEMNSQVNFQIFNRFSSRMSSINKIKMGRIK